MIDVIEHPGIEGIDTSTEIGSLLGNLALRMQARDKFKQIREGIEALKEIYESEVGYINPDTDAESYPTAVAYAALRVRQQDRKLDLLKHQERSELGYEVPCNWDFRGRRAQVIALGGRDIGTSVRNQYGLLDGLSQWHTERKGTIDEFYLGDSDGGWLTLKGRMGKVYSTGPLIVRELNIYKPAYSITLL